MVMLKCRNVFQSMSIALVVGAVTFLNLLATAVPAAGQSQGAIVGVVTDTSGAVLPGVTVIATSPALRLLNGKSVAMTEEE